eukprot:3305384-Rhodomonas_salina.1
MRVVSGGCVTVFCLVDVSLCSARASCDPRQNVFVRNSAVRGFFGVDHDERSVCDGTGQICVGAAAH